MVRKKKSLKKSKKKSSDKVCEIFKIGNKDKEKIITSCGESENKPATKEQIKKQNKILKNFFIGLGIFILFIIALFLIANQMKKFEYEGVDFEIVHEKNLIFYKTSFPLYSDLTGKYTRDYNFYIRTDPRKLGKEIPFKGTLILLENFVVNATEDFNCDGDGIIGVANMIIPLQVLGANVTKNESATCDSDGKYIFVNIEPGEKTEIVQTDVTCYSIKVADCEILKATERFMLETFIEVNKHS